jgi:hypothetical protein
MELGGRLGDSLDMVAPNEGKYTPVVDGVVL